MYINGMLFLTTISHDIFYRTAQHLPSKNKTNQIKCMQEVINLYKFAELNIKTIHCDQEFRYTLQELANKEKIELLCEPAQSHIPRAERNIRTIKERV